MNTYTFYWKDGKKMLLQGLSPADAMNRAGFGVGSLSDLDFYAEGHDNKYLFVGKQWTRKEECGMGEPDISDLDEKSVEKEKKNKDKFHGSSFFGGLLIGAYVAFFLGGLVIKCSTDEGTAKETQALFQQQGIIKYAPQSGKLKISPEFNTNGYYWYQGIPGVKLEWWQ